MPNIAEPRPLQENSSAPSTRPSGLDVGVEQLVEVLVGRLRVADLEADRTADLHDVPDGHRLPFGVDAQDAPDEEVAPFVAFGVLVHGHADLEAAGHQFAVVLVEELTMSSRRARAG